MERNEENGQGDRGQQEPGPFLESRLMKKMSFSY